MYRMVDDMPLLTNQGIEKSLRVVVLMFHGSTLLAQDRGTTLGLRATD
jgi:hypothetical protein